MTVALFCGSLGTRLREHSETIPKPLVTMALSIDFTLSKGGRKIELHTQDIGLGLANQ